MLIDSQSINAFKGEVNYAVQKDRNRVCIAESGQWFFHHPQYEAFRNGKGAQLLFVTAEAGGGKSTVMRTLVDELQERDNHVAYFFFKDDDDRLRSYDEALSGLIYQLLVQNHKFLKHVQDIHKQYGDSVKHNIKVMWTALSHIAASTPRTIYCVLDAIDECEATGRNQLATDLIKFFQDTTQTNSQLRFVVSSRPYQDQNHQYDKLISSSRNNIRHLAGENAAVQLDIQKVIRSKAEELALKRHLDQATRDLLIEKLSAQNRHTRSFLAIQIAFELLDSHHRMYKGAGERTISIILSDIPDSLGELFDTMLSRSLNQQHTRRLFSVILAARRTIRIDEFKVIYALTEPTDPAVPRAKSYGDLEIPSDDEEFKQLVRSRCGLFITFVRNSVHLFHQTAREYLLAREQDSVDNFDISLHVGSQDTGSKQSSWKRSITLSDANLITTAVCLDIIAMDIPQDWPSEAFDAIEAGNNCSTEVDELVSTRPFYCYAACNWHEHVTNAGDRGTQLLSSDRYKAALDVSQPPFWAWYLTMARLFYSPSHRDITRNPISSVWEARRGKFVPSYGALLHETCLRVLYHMDDKLTALLDDSAPFVPQDTVQNYQVVWKAEGGLHLIDRFYLAYGEYDYCSFHVAVRAIERGESERAFVLLPTNTPPNILIWTSIFIGAPCALEQALANTTDSAWLHDVPEHIMHRHERWSGWSSWRGQDLRKSRQEGWKYEYPPAFPVMLRSSTLPNSSACCEVLADWVDRQVDKRSVSQEIWNMGGFILPPLCYRLVSSGASIETALWRDQKSALQVAAACWEHDAMQGLLEQGADATRTTANGYNALHWFFQHEPIYMGDRQRPSFGEPQDFQHLYKKNKIRASVMALIDSVSDKQVLLNQLSSEGKTPLMCAVRSNRSSPTAIKVMLDEGVQVDTRDNHMRTALMHFLIRDNHNEHFVNRSTSIINMLLHAGADSRASDADGKTVMRYWASITTESNTLSNLYAGYNAYNKCFHALANIGPMAEHEILVQELRDLKIPLSVAVQLGNTQMCIALLAAGANPNEHGMAPGSQLTNNNGSESMDLEDLEWNPLMMALRSRAFVTAGVLLTHGADINFRIPERKRTKYNKYRLMAGGVMPLHLAVANKSVNWYGQSVQLKTGGVSQPCAFRAVGRVDYPTQSESAWEKLAKLQQTQWEQGKWNRRAQREENSDAEYETRHNRSSNDCTGADFLPFDVIPLHLQQLQSAREPLLEALYDPESTLLQRQEALIEHMLSKGALVNACTVKNVTSLGVSVTAGLLNITKLLLRYSADPNVANIAGCTPLMKAAQAGRLDIVECLLAAGADPNAQAKTVPPEKCKCSSLIDWGNWGHHVCEAPLTALVVAAECGHKEVVELLLRHGADPNLAITHHVHGKVISAYDKRRQQHSGPSSSSDDELDEDREEWKGFISVGTALTWARGEVRELLLEHGADPGVEQPLRECDCASIEKRPPKKPGAPDTDEENLSDS